MTGHAIQTSLILLVPLCSHVAATTFEVTKFYHSWSNVKFGGAEGCVTDSDIANRTGIGDYFTYGKNQSGREKAKQMGFSPFTYWVFLITSNLLAWLEIIMYVKKLAFDLISKLRARP